jgi:hypothetical protein
MIGQKIVSDDTIVSDDNRGESVFFWTSEVALLSSSCR